MTSASERSFQVPFCQLLSAQGERLVYIAQHGAFEKGKDVITVTPEGRVRAYQMKGGDIRLSDWHDMKGQINTLVEEAINLPSVSSQDWHEPYLVTNGRIDDTVLDYINNANVGYARRSHPHPLRTIEKASLVRQFTDLHGTFLPKETRDFQALLALILRDGRSPLDKDAFAAFMERTLDLSAEKLTKQNAARAITSSLLLTSYILGGSAAVANHWAQFETWTIVCGYILGIATRDSLNKKYWRASYDLALLSARRALEDLVQECRERTEYIEGHQLGDGYFYGTRKTLLVGLIAAWALNQRRAGSPSQFPLGFFINSLRQSFFWGESAAPYLSLVALELEMNCHSREAESLMFEILNIAASVECPIFCAIG